MIAPPERTRSMTQTEAKNALAAIVMSPDVRSTLRKVILIGAAYGCAKGGMNAEATAAVMGLVASILQAWSHYDDGKIGAKAAMQAVAATEILTKLKTEGGRPFRELSADELEAMKDVGVCAVCGEEAALGVGDELCRPCIAKRSSAGIGRRFPLGMDGGIPTDGNGAETK